MRATGMSRRAGLASCGTMLGIACLVLMGGVCVPTAGAQAPGAATAAAKPAPYSLPWQLRPVTAGTVVRLDETLALYHDAAGDAGSAAVTSLIASWKKSPSLVPLFRVSWVANQPPGTAPSGSALSNVLLGVSYVRPVRDWKSSMFLAATLPTGQGGGDAPDPAQSRAIAAGVPARSAMDNALFAVNYWTMIGGIGAAHVDPAMTVQVEATLLRLTLARGPASQDGARTNFTSGLHLGHFFSPRASLGGELRYQRWLTDAAPVRGNPDARETVTMAIGPRFHFPLSGKRWIRPGLSWTHALDAPLADQSYDMIQVDCPMSF